MPDLTLPGGTIRYIERGPTDGPPVLFVHGVLVGGALWDDVLQPLADRGYRAIAPDWPIGGHELPFPMDPGGPDALADVVLAFCSQLGLEDVTLVGNDSGGGVCQFVVARNPRRIGRLVLTNSDGLDAFPPKVYKPLIPLLRSKLGLAATLATYGGPLGGLAAAPLSKRVHKQRLRTWVQHAKDPAVREDIRRFAEGLDQDAVWAMSAKLRDFHGPMLAAWGEDDLAFTPALGRRITALFRDGRYVGIPDARCFVSWDQPEVLAELVAGFIAETSSDGSAPRSIVPAVPGNSRSAS